MSITLNYSSTTLTLDPDLKWVDEHQWHPVEQTAQRSVTGALVVSTAARISGRPITLQPDDENSAWMPRSMIDTLRSWAGVPGRQMTLTLRGVARTVIFRHHDGIAVEASPVIFYSDEDGSDWYKATLRFMEI